MGGLGAHWKVNTGKGIPVLDFELTDISGIRCPTTSIFSVEDINKSAEGHALTQSEEGLEKSPEKIWQGVNNWLIWKLLSGCTNCIRTLPGVLYVPITLTVSLGYCWNRGPKERNCVPPNATHRFSSLTCLDWLKIAYKMSMKNVVEIEQKEEDFSLQDPFFLRKNYL